MLGQMLIKLFRAGIFSAVGPDRVHSHQFNKHGPFFTDTTKQSVETLFDPSFQRSWFLTDPSQLSLSLWILLLFLTVFEQGKKWGIEIQSTNLLMNRRMGLVQNHHVFRGSGSASTGTAGTSDATVVAQTPIPPLVNCSKREISQALHSSASLVYDHLLIFLWPRFLFCFFFTNFLNV